jgi:uncharacterized protein YaiL (DUF2058 family)
MANSFGDQFLKAGLVNKTRLNEAKKSKSKQEKLKHKQKIEVVDEAAVAARQAAAEKVARDRELNRRQKGARAQGGSCTGPPLIELNRLPRDDGGWVITRTVRRSEDLCLGSGRDKLGRGLLAIARFDDGYEVIPSVVAEKIRQRDEDCIVSHVSTRPENGEDDPYADYKVPDDLMW